MGFPNQDNYNCIKVWLKIGIHLTNLDKIRFFCQHSHQLHNFMQKVIEILEFTQGVNNEFNDSFENNDTEY